MRADPAINRLLFVSVIMLLATPAYPDEPSSPPSPARVENHESPGEADPFASGPAATPTLVIPANRGDEPRATLALRLEIWEIDGRMAVSLLDSAPAKEVAEKIRTQLTADASTKLIHCQLLTLDERTQSANEATVEQIYPTEYEPPEGLPQPTVPATQPPQNPADLSEKLQDLFTSACPSAFDTRNTGLTFEAQVQPVQAEGGCWDASLIVEEVLLVRADPVGSPLLGVTMPVFSTFRLNTAIRLTESRWQIASLAEPPRGNPGETADRRWLTLIRLDRAR